MGKLQEILTKTMTKAGTAVEKIAELASRRKPAKPKKTGIVDEKGEDFGAIQWDERHIHALLSGAERKEIFSLLPSLAGKKILHLTPGDRNYLETLQKKKAEDIVELDVRKSAVSLEEPQVPPHPFARGTIEKLPFKEDIFDFILYPSALAWRADLLALIPELGRCTKESGRVVISTVHPFFEYLMNPRGGFRKNFSSLFSEMKKSGFFIDELREGFLDESLRYASLPTKMTQELRRFQGMPIILLLRGIHLRKRKAG